MVNSDSLSDIFASEKEEKCDPISSVNGVLPHSSNSLKVRHCFSDNNNSFSVDSSECGVDNSEDSLSLRLHSERDKPCSSGKSVIPESQSSEETFLSINTSISFEDNKDNIFNNDLLPKKKVYLNTPDMFEDSQETSDRKEIVLRNSPVTKIDGTKCTKNSESLNEEHLKEDSSESNPQVEESCSSNRRTSSDCDASSESSSILEEVDSSQDLQCSQGPSQDSSERFVSPIPQDSALDYREPQKLWDTQELARVSQRLALRRKQARRLILTVIRKRQMAQETLDAFKKRLKRF